MISPDYLYRGPYCVCVISQKPHWMGKPGRILGPDRYTLNDALAAQRALQVRSKDPLGIWDNEQHKWVE